MIASVLIALTLGGSVATTTVPPAFAHLQNPGTVKVNHDLVALAGYYNGTLTDIGQADYQGASFLIDTFHFVNISPAVNTTALAANADLTTVNITAYNATVYFQNATAALAATEYVNASAFAAVGCTLAQQANSSFADFQGAQTSGFRAESVPVSGYSKGEAAAGSLVASLLAECASLQRELTFAGLTLTIASPQASVETGGTLELTGTLTFRGSPVSGDGVYFYINGSYFGSLTTDAQGGVSGTLTIPYVYFLHASVEAIVAPSARLGVGGATSNALLLDVLFNQTSIVIGDPPAVLPTFSFSVQGNLSTASGVPLPDAPVEVTFFNQSQLLRTDGNGVFTTRLTVPANATDGIYYVDARFAPEGVLGPSVNFTSIRVVHLPMRLTVSAPSFTLAGFTMTVSGRASANGTALPGAVVRVSSPWGGGNATTDASGVYTFELRVSAYEFAFSRNVSATAVSVPPYVAPATASRPVGLFNILLVTLPAAAVGVAGYEADKLGAFERLRARSRKASARAAVVQEAAAFIPAGAGDGQGVLDVCRSALHLAAKRFGVRPSPSSTFREVVASVREKGAEGADRFAEIMLAAEDFLYSERFDVSRVGSAKESLRELEALWA